MPRPQLFPAPLCLLAMFSALLFADAAPARIASKDDPVTLQQAWNPKPDALDIELPMPCGLKMAFRAVAVPGEPGQEFPFMMGLANADKERRIYGERREGRIAGAFTANDLPIAWRALLEKSEWQGHTVYLIGKYEVSQAQWDAVMNETCPAPEPPKPAMWDKLRGKKPDAPAGADLPATAALPVREISWADMQSFLGKYNEWLHKQPHALPRFVDNQKKTGFVRLPTEAEWEFAARGGMAVKQTERDNDAPFAPGKAEEYAVFAGKSRPTEPEPIGSRLPNALGLYDTAGNVKELLDEAFQRGGSAGGVLAKGGGFRNGENEVLPGWRDEANRYNTPNDQGFRLVLTGELTASARRMENLNAMNPDEEKARREAERRQAEQEKARAAQAEVEKARRDAEEQTRLAQEQARAAEEEARKARLELEQMRQAAAEEARRAAEQAKEAEQRALEAKQEQERLRQAAAEEARRAAEQAREAERRALAAQQEQERQRQAAAEQARKTAEQARASAAPRKTWTNSIGMEFVLIPAGTFAMGCSSEAEECSDDEYPQHNVTISQPFYLGKYEVTQAQWQAVMGNNPSSFQGADRPVENVSWDDAQEFISRLNAKEGHRRYRLPTEAEWEYAVRAGSSVAYSFGNDASRLGNYAWYRDNAGRWYRGNAGPNPVGGKLPNAWGLYDMHGNVWEWVADWYGGYSGASVTDPRGPSAGKFRVLRGGGWNGDAGFCRSAYRFRGEPDDRGYDFGFRLALSCEECGEWVKREELEMDYGFRLALSPGR